MTTIAQAIAQSPLPRLETRLLLQHITGLSHSQLITRDGDLLPPEQEAQWRQLCRRREQGEPVAYLLGSREFYGRTFAVNRHVLIPRPETEHLLEAALCRLPAGGALWDMGTGSGIIAVSAKLERPEKFAIIDTVAKKRTVYSLPQGVSYTFRSLGRGPQGEALLLTTDGKLRIFDPATGSELGSVQLMDAWSESETWQDPRPALWVDGKTAYVSDPATKKLHAVNIADAKAPKTLVSVELPQTPNELSGTSSSKPAPTQDHGHGESHEGDHGH